MFTEKKDNDVKKEFYNELERVCDTCPKYDIKIILGDLNAKLRREEQDKEIICRYSLHDKINENDLNVGIIDFATSKDLRVEPLMFPHKKIHKEMWTSLVGSSVNQIDHILINSRNLSSLRGASSDSDHFLVRAKLRIRTAIVKNRKVEKQNKWSVYKLFLLQIV